jgi:hypothetical protein
MWPFTRSKWSGPSLCLFVVLDLGVMNVNGYTQCIPETRLTCCLPSRVILCMLHKPSTHSTDGMSYQPDVTWCDNGDAGLSDNIYQWLRSEMAPDLTTFLQSMNHIPGPCYYANDHLDPYAGSYPYYSDGPDYSGNYADHRQLPAYLLEIHSLKPNKQRVLGAYAFLHGVTTIVAEKIDSLRDAIQADKAARVDPVPIAWTYDGPTPTMEWPVFNWTIRTNPTLNITQITWSSDPTTITAPESIRSTPADPPQRPFAYIVPAVYGELVERLAIHGIEMEVFLEEADVEVMNYRVDDYDTGRRQGRAVVSAGTPVPEVCTGTYKKNDVMIKTDQDLGTLAVALLDPKAEGSLYYWGFFNAAFHSHESPENCIMIPLAEKMLAENEEIAAEWQQYVAENPQYYTDADADAVLNWFFRRTQLYDVDSYVYPVGFVMSDPGALPLEPMKAGVSGGGGSSISTATNGDHDDIGCPSSAQNQRSFVAVVASILALVGSLYFCLDE